MAKKEWWRGAVIYQIYPRSYYDSNGDGIGDLPGITEKLGYVASLGVDAIWLSPFFTSPMKDFGYDVSDYRDVDPIFGTLDDFRTLLDKAHSLGLKIIIDQVMAHTSNEHAWFKESRSSRDNDKADWYVWADARPDGAPPNNWQSVFGGPSWTYDMYRGQYYLNNFLPEQPALNLHNVKTQDAILDEAAFWLDMGVDGFRLDALNFGMCDMSLRDNPPNPFPEPAFFNLTFPTPHTMQLHQHDMSQTEMFGFLERIRALLDSYDGDRMAVAEVGGERGIEVAAAYTATEKLLHTAYNFSLLSGRHYSAHFIHNAIKIFEDQPGEPWPSWAFSNHDVVRIVTRWGGAAHESDPRLAKLLIALLLSLRGTGFLYEGEELGLPEAEIKHEEIQDPWGKYLYPCWQGRDGSRTPMPWSGKPPHGGFSAAEKTWLPVSPKHLPLAVETQEKDPASVLNFTRKFLSWRKSQPALVTGTVEMYDFKSDTKLGFIRAGDGQEIACLFNLSDHECQIMLDDRVGNNLFPDESQSGHLGGDTVTLPPFGFHFARLGG